MKKLVSIFLALLISLSVAGIAEEKIDLKSFTNDEILDLRQSINKEIKNRNIDDVDIDYDEADLIENGEYLCDSDIPEGKYTIQIIKRLDWCSFAIKDNGKTIFYKRLRSDDDDGYTYTFTLKSGQSIKVDDSAIATLKKASEKNWMKK